MSFLIPNMPTRYFQNNKRFRFNTIVVSILFLFNFTTMPFVFAQDNNTQTIETGVKQVSTHVEDLRYHVPSDVLSSMTVNVKNHEFEIPFIKYPSRQPINKGLVILISEMQAQGQIDASLNALAKSLPDWGWNTILITPDQAYIETIKTQNEVPTNSQASDSENSSEPGKTNTSEPPQVGIKANAFQIANSRYTHSEYLLFLSALHNSINAKFSEQPGYKMVYVSGKSAAGFISILNQSDSLEIDALVVNNPYWPSLDHNKKIPAQLASISVPVLDLISMPDNNWTKQTSNERKTASKIGLKPMYRQSKLMNAGLTMNQPHSLAKEVVSWTYYLGW